MKKIIYSRTDGKAISKFFYRLLWIILVFCPSIIVVLYADISEMEPGNFYTIVLLQIIIFAMAYFSTNLVYFELQKDSIVVLNGMVNKKREIVINEIKTLAIVGAALLRPVKKRLGYYGSNKNFCYYPYLLIYTDEETVKYEGEDVMSYKNYVDGFIVYKDNHQAFNRIINETMCTIYIDEAFTHNNYRLFELLHEMQAANRIQLIHNDNFII